MFKYVFMLVLSVVPLISMGAEFVEGKDYQRVSDISPTLYKGGPIEVTEFFSYGCPWCYRLEGGVDAWVNNQGKEITFSKVPVVFNKNWVDYARAYYLIDGLSLGKSIHHALFKLIIVDKKPLSQHAEMVSFFTNNGVNASLVESAFSHSPSIELQLKSDEALMAQYQINAVPTLVINHQYKTNLQMAKSEERLFEIMDYLVKQVKKTA
jgi:thiol:disulfide interchange protein DsbA